MSCMMQYVFIISVVFSVFNLNVLAIPKTNSKAYRPRVCVIGAGLAGLTSAKYLNEEGIAFTVIEATGYVGGTWRYDPRVGSDENGQPIHTSMYKHLRTNLPKQTMELRGFPVPEDMPSFPSWEIYYEYIQSYTKHFDLEKHIKFYHNVVLVSRVENMWQVKYQNVKTNEEFVEHYDFVFVANGHHTKPHLPNIPGEDNFLGTIIHSHDYREPDRYKGRRVLIVGSGPSGMDISLDIADVSKTLVHSHHSKINFRTPFPENYVRKPDVKEFNETGVVFVDDSYEDIDDVILCTGFEYNYPFLDESCELSIKTHSVAPLYKYMVNINQPTLLLMGLIVRACLVVAIDAQSRYATALVKGNFTLPSKEEIMDEWQRKFEVIHSQGRPLSDLHLLAEKEDEYYAELTRESGIDRVPPVMFKIRILDMQAKIENLYTYRDYDYTIIDNETCKRTSRKEHGTNSSTCLV